MAKAIQPHRPRRQQKFGALRRRDGAAIADPVTRLVEFWYQKLGDRCQRFGEAAARGIKQGQFQSAPRRVSLAATQISGNRGGSQTFRHGDRLNKIPARFELRSHLATPQQQAIVAARIFTANPSGGDWGAGRPGRENADELAAGLVPASLASLTFGGNSALPRNTRTSGAEAYNQTTWNSLDNKHRWRLTANTTC